MTVKMDLVDLVFTRHTTIGPIVGKKACIPDRFPESEMPSKKYYIR
jgi:hypothetical protein